jgi:hypothetical protein
MLGISPAEFESRKSVLLDRVETLANTSGRRS